MITVLKSKIHRATVTDANLNVLIGEIRRALDDAARQPRYVRTVHGVGYAFCGEATEVTELLERYGVEVCVYGHLHGDGIAAGFTGVRNGIRYQLLSADSVGFAPVEVAPALFRVV